MTGMWSSGWPRLALFEDHALVALRIRLRQRVELQQAGEVAAGHLRLVLLRQLAVVDERAGRAGTLEGPLRPEQQPLGTDRLGEVFRPVVDLKAGELDVRVRVPFEEREHIAGLIPLRLLKQHRQAGILRAHPRHLGERRLLILLSHSYVDEERKRSGFERGKDRAANLVVEAVAVAAREHLGRPHAPLLHLGHDLRTRRHLARVVRHEHPARQQPVVGRRLLHQHVVAVAGVVLARQPVPHERAVDAGVLHVVEQGRGLPRHPRVGGAVHADGGAGVEVAHGFVGVSGRVSRGA